MDWWNAIPGEQQFTITIAFLSAVLGGTVSIVTSLAVFSVTKRSERKRADAQLISSRNTAARIGLAKFVAITNHIYSMKKAIDVQFEEANAEGQSIQEPGLAIRAMVSGVNAIEKLTGAELEFLFFTDSGDLVTRIHLLQSKTSTHFAMVEQYNSEHAALSEIIEESLGHETSMDGLTVTVALEGNLAKRAEMKVGAMNVLLADMIEKLERDLEEAFSVGDAYQAAAEKVFGDKFPKIELMEKLNANP